MNEHDLYNKGFRKGTDGTWRKGRAVAPAAPPDGLAEAAKRKQNSSDESMGKTTGAIINPGRRRVRITSYRLRLCDERNLFDKYITDALVYSRLLRDDSSAWSEIQVEQVQVCDPASERTEIEIFELC